MKHRILILFLFILIPSVLAHEAPEHEAFEPPAERYPISPLEATGYGSIVLFLLLFVAWYYGKRLTEPQKRLLFLAITLATILPTAYLVFTTVHLNIISVTGGPVHWHADYEVWVCGEEVRMLKPKFPDNKIGTALIHDHGDNRIHVEGVLLSHREASLGAFFHAIGGTLTRNQIIVPSETGMVVMRNGDLCNGLPGSLHVFVNGERIHSPSEYVIAPYETVPQGDTIKIVFTAEPREQINSYTRGYGRARRI